jgi:hypothetical protein
MVTIRGEVKKSWGGDPMIRKYIGIAFFAAVVFLSGCVTTPSTDYNRGYCGMDPVYCGPGR